MAISVAVIGSGPAGLSCAHYLALRGYAVTVFEALPEAGGLFIAGIPEYRLPREVVRKEVELIRSLGVEVRTAVTVGPRRHPGGTAPAEAMRPFSSGSGPIWATS